MDDNSQLERAARDGDPVAFGQLIRRWDHDLRGVVWSVVRSAPATDDVMQTAYEKAFRSIAEFDGRSALKTWMHSICYRAAIDHIRYETRRRHDELDSLLDTSNQTQASTAATAIGKAELDEVLNTLSPEQRAMLMLTAGHGYSFDETAQILGENRGTVASRVGRARKRLLRWETEQ